MWEIKMGGGGGSPPQPALSGEAIDHAPCENKQHLRRVASPVHQPMGMVVPTQGSGVANATDIGSLPLEESAKVTPT